MADFDLDCLVNLEQTFFDSGYKDGFDHGRIHGLIEGRALGREKGFEMWEEIGFYEGFARIYSSILKSDHRGANHAQHLLTLISQFPKTNPSITTAQAADGEEVDIPKLFRQIRSRYKALCSSVGVRPSLRGGEGHGDEGVAQKSPIWKIDDKKLPQDEDMSF